MPVEERKPATFNAPPLTVVNPPVLMESTLLPKRVAVRVSTCAVLVPEKRKRLNVVVAKVPLELSKFAMTDKVPALLLIVPRFVIAPVVVAVPLPTLRVPPVLF